MEKRPAVAMIVLLGLTFVATLLSQSAMDLLSSLLCVWLLLSYFKLRKTPAAFELFPKTGLEYVWILWFLIVALGYMSNAAPGAPWLVRLVEFKWILLLYFTLAAMLMILWKAKMFTKLFSGAMIVCSGLALGMFFYLRPERLEGLLNPMTFAHMYGPCFCLLVALGIVGWNSFLQNTQERILWLLATALTALAVLLTFTRGVWIGCFLGIFLMGFMFNWLMGLALSGAGLVAFGTMFFGWSSFHDRILQVFDPQKSYDVQRVVLWKTNWFIFKQHPILGIGYGENGRRLREFYDQLGVPPGQFESHAHNQYLHFLAGTGILGTAVYVFLAFYFLYNSFQLFRKLREPFARALALGCFGALICFYASGFTESNFEHAKVRMIVAFAWAIILMLKRRPQLEV